MNQASVRREKKTIAVLGATGSVGRQALDVAKQRGFSVDLMSAGSNVSDMETLVRCFSPRLVAMADEGAARDLKTRISDTGTRVFVGADGICEAIGETRAETVVNSILGAAGLSPTLAVLERGKRLALANKESLVIAGDIVMRRAAELGAQILPVDSEHCAIFQCLRGAKRGEVRRLILTASGGPFYGYDAEQLQGVTLAQTLAHPTWKMGKKITVDSATLMNKGFEILEAAHLFDIPADRIEVVVHRESILHSAVEYIDNSMIGEFSVPDMRTCVAYAVDYPDRMEAVCEPLDLFAVGKMTFSPPDHAAFPLLSLAVRASRLGGGMGAVLNAADEVAVDAFLRGRIAFYRIAECVMRTFDDLLSFRTAATLAEREEADREARRRAEEIVAHVGCHA